ncbi:fatty oxidation complex subunit alpha [Kocuria tytonicola]|uniref:3-hydroxyacyl-CoA dehydrogenase NAD-binding domain-containing protein n=1 Tax=Kocuria tytonicola TaxID=2055946 RepID=UPI000EF8D981|nr:3-hydroxyacyl-CoA dehydrogenase NAD-binding domain-containing protein [Kocuria tytonicola]RLZ03612.1 fatty oxidation complex subunit alpha [Kocuria tytonicola]
MSEQSFPSTVTITVTTPVLPGRDKPIALVTLDSTAPNGLVIWGSEAMRQLQRELAAIDTSQVEAVVVTGNEKSFGAGANLKEIRAAQLSGTSDEYVGSGHDAFGILAEMDVPTFSLITGVTLGGGLELALHTDYRLATSGKAPMGLPECHLGFFPGWGGVYLLPHLVGAEAALNVIVTDSMRGKNLNPAKAAEIGLVDALLDGAPGSQEWEEAWQNWVVEALEGKREPRRPSDGAQTWDAAVAKAAAKAQKAWHGAAPGPVAAIELVGRARTESRVENGEAAVEAFKEIVQSEPARASLYAFELVSARSKQAANVPDAPVRKIRKAAVIGAGLMAGQLASLIAQGARIPVVMTDLDDERLATGVQRTRDRFTAQAEKGRMTPEQAEQLGSLITGAKSPEDLADADFVIEAVFEELDVKRQVFAQWEPVVSEDAILATNTSSLSITAMGRDLQHPERLVGFHVFNPVEVTPLLEIVAGEKTDDSTLATAFDLAAKLRRIAVRVEDAPSFVVNRVLTRMFDEIGRAMDAGGDPETVDHALDAMGLPMTPLQLLDFVGPAVLVHITHTMHDAYPDRFTLSPWLDAVADAGLRNTLPARGETSETYLSAGAHEALERTRQENGVTGQAGDGADGELLTRVQDALADEIGHMLDEGVVATARDVDLCMILGANYPFHLGGITPYLDRCGAAERVRGHRFDAAQQ